MLGQLVNGNGEMNDFNLLPLSLVAGQQIPEILWIQIWHCALVSFLDIARYEVPESYFRNGVTVS